MALFTYLFGIGSSNFGFFWGIAGIAFRIFAVIDIATGDFREKNQKLIWLLVTILGGTIGCIIYFAIGRKNRIPKS